MGSCLGCAQSEGEKQNNTISRQIERDKRTGNKLKKILFLGSGGSGKSTIFKQLRGIYGSGFNHQERKVFVSHIHEQVITQMKLALEILEEYRNGDLDGILHQNEIKYIDKKAHQTDIKEDIEDDGIDYDDDYNEEEFDGTIPELTEAGQEQANVLTDIHYTSYKLNDEIVYALKCLWSEPAIQKMYEMRNITKIVDSSAYFWDKLDSLNVSNYVPDEADILLVRYRTTGATEEKYEMPDGKGSFSIIDVGGQKSERKKWIKCFDAVTAVIFVASLSCYDEVLYEDYSTNSMTDQLELFDDICNNDALKETSMILFLNKKDLFADKIKKVPLTTCLSFIEYNGPKVSFDKTTKYIRKSFTSLNNMPSRKNIFTHITCATDQDNIQKVFADVQHIVIEASLIQAGLMDWDDNQRYKSVDSSKMQENDPQENDPQTAQRVRDSIMTSNARKQKSMNYMAYNSYASNQPVVLSSMSTVSSGYNSNFREIIKKKSYPQLDFVDYSRIFMEYDYDEDINKNAVYFNDENGLLNGKYCWGQSFKVFGKKKALEKYMILDIEPNVEMQSKINRKNMNLCIILDVGRTMSNDFDDGNKKMVAVKQMIIDIIKNQLNDRGDRLSVVTFGMKAKVVLEVCEMGDIDKDNLCKTIMNIECEIQSLDSQRVDYTGYQFGVSQFRKLATQKKDMDRYLNRIVMITTTRLSQKILTECADISKKGYYSTFIGISNRFSLQRTILSDVNGCNYFNINSSESLKEKILNRFDEIVTPVLFDLNVQLNVNGGDRCVDSIYRLNGEDENEEVNMRGNSNKIFTIKTLFLRRRKYETITDDDDRLDRNINNRHLLLIKLINNYYDFELMVSYTNDRGNIVKNPISIALQKTAGGDDNEENKDDALLNGSSGYELLGNNNKEEYYDNNSVRKGILLLRYITILREWIGNQRRNGLKPSGNYVGNEFQQKFETFYKYFKQQAKFINDDKSLNKEINVLSSLFNA